MYCIYRITNCVNGKTYIGQHKYKKTLYDKYMGSGKVLKQAYNKYGIDNFIKDIIVADIKDKETINKLEIKYIAYERESNGNGCYNIANGGEGGCGPHSEEWKRKHSEIMKGKPSPNKGKKPWNKDKKIGPMSEETKRKMSEAHKGNKPWNIGKKLSEETKRKIAKACKGHIVSEETKRKISETHKKTQTFRN